MLLGKTELVLVGGNEMLLKTEFGCHVTMDPGLHGTISLPDNVKTLFRPVAMMVPDYALITEGMLFAEGFSNAKALAKKLVYL